MRGRENMTALFIVWASLDLVLSVSALIIGAISLRRTRAPRVKQAFYDPLGSIFEGHSGDDG